MTDESRLDHIARAYIPKYGKLFMFTVRDGSLWIEGSDDPGMTSEVRPTKALAFAKGTIFSQTRWLFGSA